MDDKQRKYFAVSIEHSKRTGKRKWRFGDPLTLWGYRRTKDGEERCFSRYTERPWKAELYALGDFTAHGYNSWGVVDIKDDEPVKICADLVRKYEKYNSVLVEESDLISYYKTAALKTTDEKDGLQVMQEKSNNERSNAEFIKIARSMATARMKEGSKDAANSLLLCLAERLEKADHDVSMQNPNGRLDNMEDAGESSKAALALDLFTKLWCRVEDPDDLKFRCKGCPMELQDKTCAAKLWKMQNAPHYRNFGSMGDL